MLERMFSHQDLECALNRENRPSWIFGSILTLEYVLPGRVAQSTTGESSEVARCHRRVDSYIEAMNLIDSWVNLPLPWSPSDVEDHARGLGWVRMSAAAKEQRVCAQVSLPDMPAVAKKPGVSKTSRIALEPRLPLKSRVPLFSRVPAGTLPSQNVPLIALTVHPPRSHEKHPRKDALLESTMRFLLDLLTERYGEPEIESFWGGEYRDWLLPNDLRLRLSFGLGMSTVWIYDPALKEHLETFVTLPDNLPEDFGRSPEEQPPYRTFKRRDFSERWRRDREVQLEFRQNASSSLKVSVWSWLAVLALLAYPIVLLIQLVNKIWGE